MQTRRFTRLPGMTLAVMLTMLVGQGLVFGHDDGDRKEPRKLEGTWNVTLLFPDCTSQCPCPGGVPNIPIPGLHMYLKHGSFLATSGGSLLSGPQLGSWEGIGHHQFEARYKFFLFNPDGSPRGNEEVRTTLPSQALILNRCAKNAFEPREPHKLSLRRHQASARASRSSSL